jgi:predicted Zn-dependent peptidase
VSEPRLHRLGNGLTIVVEQMPGVATVATGLYCDVGSRSEADGKGGLAHLVEHMMFKGAGGRNARQIAEAVEDVGGALNAWTARDATAFHARLLAEDLSLGLELIADLIRAPLFDPAELEREKQVVLSELGEARDTPDDIVFDQLFEAAYPDQPFGRPVIGTEASIASLTTQDLQNWLAEQYRPGGLVLAAAGKVDEEALLKLAEARFGDMAAGQAATPDAAQFATGIHYDRRRFDQTQLALAWEGLSHNDTALPALSLFVAAAGGGMSSRLFQEIREARGLAYSVAAWTQAHHDTGVVLLHAAAAREQAGEALALARQVMTATAAELSQAELDRAKAQARAGFLMGLESVQARCDRLARLIQTRGRIESVTEQLDELAAVTLAQARAAGQAMLAREPALATVGGKLAQAA